MISISKPSPIYRSLALAGALIVLPLVAWAASIEVVVNGVEDDKGTIEVALYTSAKGFPETGRHTFGVSLAAGTVERGTIRAFFADLKPGAYAVAVYHDQNKNNELDTGLFGIPTEGYGFSNDAKGFMGPPSFESAVIRLRETGEVIPVTLGY